MSPSLVVMPLKPVMPTCIHLPTAHDSIRSGGSPTPRERSIPPPPQPSGTSLWSRYERTDKLRDDILRRCRWRPTPRELHASHATRMNDAVGASLHSRMVPDNNHCDHSPPPERSIRVTCESSCYGRGQPACRLWCARPRSDDVATIHQSRILSYGTRSHRHMGPSWLGPMFRAIACQLHGRARQPDERHGYASATRELAISMICQRTRHASVSAVGFVFQAFHISIPTQRNDSPD